MAMTSAERLRALLGESIPAGKTASDTLLSDDVIDDLLQRYEDNPLAARGEGWELKAALLSTLVDTTEGGSSRRLSQQHAAALKQAAAFGANSGTTRVHRLRRDWFGRVI